ncbi:PREDICTED: structure-specific endonuclease subunit SLX4 [Elephantulus edwardii]|uniref:structure-specific endonuclease subunit SLX4 n=1 Tax=Elephantulus edwardii TaxID=28737 RepID=UPI0003F0E471|nr:PREDICTED: structure-specific endonuclease subunit SLX4 [Elephantulus edwardii]
MNNPEKVGSMVFGHVQGDAGRPAQCPGPEPRAPGPRLYGCPQRRRKKLSLLLPVCAWRAAPLPRLYCGSAQRQRNNIQPTWRALPVFTAQTGNALEGAPAAAENDGKRGGASALFFSVETVPRRRRSTQAILTSAKQPEHLELSRIMEESDDDFKELCASFFQRVKKNGAQELLGKRKKLKTSDSTQKRSTLKKPKQTTAKGKTLPGPVERKLRPGSQTSRAKNQQTTKLHDWKSAAFTVNRAGPLTSPTSNQPAICNNDVQNTQTEGPSSNDVPPAASMIPSPSKLRTAELVVQRMQQFKRADPTRLKHSSGAYSPKAAVSENTPEDPPEEMVVGNGCGPGSPATDSDAAVASALQQELGQERVATREEDLEEKGWFFCQICQKNLSAMNVMRREQHVNRCLDEGEKALEPPAPPIPECPICGKLFLTSKSRSAHLKQCALKMEVGPRLLLQAVRLQTAQDEGGPSPLVSTLSDHQVGTPKRKGAPTKKETQKRQKVIQPEALSEDMLVAMALSHSEVEQCGTVPTLKLESAFSERIKLGAKKKSRKKKLPASLPPLLVQDTEATWRQTEDHVAILLAEEVEFSSTPPLPSSRILKKELVPEGRQKCLWEGSTLFGSWAPEAFYTASLVPILLPQQLAQGPTKEPTSSLMPLDQLVSGVCVPPIHHSPSHKDCCPRGHQAEPSPRKELPSSSQRERQALQDLVDLAREGLGPSTRGLASWGKEAAPSPITDLVPSSFPLSGFVLPPKEEHLEDSGASLVSLGLLVSDFGAMVNNPHLSDVQFQVDSGEVLYAHKFVLYARCPLLIQHVNSEGFFAVEDGDMRVQRVLLSDVSTQVVHAFLHYLYTADASLNSRLTPDLRSLALRFGVNALVHLCDQALLKLDTEEEEEEHYDSRADSFQELLRTVWADEGEVETPLRAEGHREDREQVDDDEMEEIYEFAATQRKLLQEEKLTKGATATEQPREDCLAPGCVRASVLVHTSLETIGNGQRSEEAPTRWTSVGQPGSLSPQGQCPHSEVATRKIPNHSSFVSPTDESWAQRRIGCLPCPIDGHKQLFSSPQEYSEPHRITDGQKEQKKVVEETSPRRPGPTMAHSPQRGSPSWSCPHPFHTDDRPLSTPHSCSATFRAVCQDSLSPDLPSRWRKDIGVPTLLTDPGHQEGKEVGSTWACRSNRVPVSPEKSLSIDLTQPDSGHLYPGPPPSLPISRRDDEVILLLDSDEELELQQSRVKPPPDTPAKESQVLEASPRSVELFSVIDIDADLEISPTPLSQTQGRLLECLSSPRSKRQLRLFCDGPSSPEQENTTDTSWLVPATPLASRSHHGSSQGRTSRPLMHKSSHLEPRVVSEHEEASGVTNILPVIVPQTAPPLLLPTSPWSSGGERWASRTLSTPQPRQGQDSSPGAPCPRQLTLATAEDVVEVEDSDDELGVAPHQADSSPLPSGEPSIPVDECCWSIEPLSPIPIDHLNLERTGPLSTSSPSNRAREATDSPACGSSGLLATTPIRGSCPDHRESQEQSPRAGSPRSSRLSLLNSALWDDWDGEDKSLEVPPLAQRLGIKRARQPGSCETPKGVYQKKNLPPKVPITPMPRYSILETPVLKKELDRFGVRPLPKRQMVLKLKEIFQYTHQTLDSDSEDEILSSQVPPAHTTLDIRTSRAGGQPPAQATAGPSHQRHKEPTGMKGVKSPRCKRRQPEASPQPQHMSPPTEGPACSDGDNWLPASQESAVTSMDSNDGSVGSQSSSCQEFEFGAALESEGDNGEEGVTSSQAAAKVADTEAAVWRFIRSQPALYRRVLLYQPLELAELRTELRGHGIHMAAGRLLDFLDAQCVTFTTSAARKEQLGRQCRRPRGRKRRGQE